MAIFKKRSTDPAEIERLKAEITAMGARLEAADRRLADAETAKTELGEQVRGIVTRLDTPIAPPPQEPPPSPPPTVDPAELAELRRRIDELLGRLDALDGRVTSIAVELANQINELSGELDAAAAAGDASSDAATGDMVIALQDAQTRLANEQARYQIAFRQDLADLAERLKRS